jgi:hypothetical protein
MLCAALALMTAGIVISSFHRRPRVWPAGEVPVAFWSWRNQTPSQSDVRAAIEKTPIRTLFLRAGQIDYQDGKLRRIRPADGPFPKGIELHLVYNATRSLLANLDGIDERSLAGALSQAFQTDRARAAAEGANVSGLQIDFDVPTRSLSRYERTLKALRTRLPKGMQLSITGLPTWMQSSELRSTLAQVDFWIPQFYGAEIPERSDQAIPIASLSQVERFVNDARDLNKPFYAGLAAYSYALLYDPAGALISLRGDMDPAAIATDPNLELLNLRRFDQTPGEWRYAYRARADGVTDGLAMRAGDVLIVDDPSTESLRVSARAVRQLGGENLLGLCVFRLPAADDPATLAIDQVVTALADRDSTPDFQIIFKANQKRPAAWSIEIRNTGTAGAIDGLRIDLPVGSAAIQSVTAGSGASIETICRLPGGINKPIDQPCSQSRANVVRIAAHGLRSGQSLKVFLTLNTSLPKVLPVSIEARTDAGASYVDERTIPVESGGR